MSEKVLLNMTGIAKTFPGVRALKGVNFSVREGEVHALMGENGAGKSCLIKILTGIYTKDAGTITFDGREIAPVTSLQAQKYGISTIYQELNLIPYLSIAENIFLGREPKNRLGIIDWERVNREAKEILAGMDIYEDVTKSLNSYSTAIQQMTAIARAVSQEAKLIVMDEPTSSLDDKEVKVIFNTIRTLQKRKVAVIFVSHRLDELYEICDRVTILKDGEMVGVSEMDKISKYELISKMVGKPAQELERRKEKNETLDGAKEFISVKGISNSTLHNVDFKIKKGEIVGLAGLLGSGRTELANVLFGNDSAQTKEFSVDGTDVKIKNPRDAIAHRFALCPEDRKVDGIIPNMSVRENISIILLPKLTKMGVVDKKKQKKIVSEYIELLKIKTPHDNQPVRFLSGGNQQKVILARWLCAKPDLIILDEPTRGIDVGAKAEIEDLIQEFAKEGISILMISSEMEEISRNSDRLEIMRDGAVVGTLDYDEISQQTVMEIIARGTEEKREANG